MLVPIGKEAFSETTLFLPKNNIRLSQYGKMKLRILRIIRIKINNHELHELFSIQELYFRAIRYNSFPAQPNS